MRITILMFLLGCQVLPERPEGEMCAVNLAEEILLCCPIESVSESGEVSLEEEKCRIKPFVEIDKHICFDPDTWGNVALYIRQLKWLASKKLEQCSELTDI